MAHDPGAGSLYSRRGNRRHPLLKVLRDTASGCFAMFDVNLKRYSMNAPPRPARCRIRRTTRRHRRRVGAETTASSLYDAGGCRIGASASRLPSRHGGTEPISTPRKRPSGVRTLTKRGPAAFPAPSSQIPSASTCLAPASSFCGRSFQTRKTSFRSSSRATEPPGARVTLYGSELGAYCVLSFS